MLTVTALPEAPPVALGRCRWLSPPLGRVVAAAVAVGVLVRLALVLASDFPLNDGALFLAMARAVRAAHYALPAYVTYNGTAIPFGYPPLGFYVVAALHDVTGLDMVQALRLVPFAATSACLIAFVAFARDLLPRVTAGVTRTEPALAGAAVAFALLPRTYTWLLMGGGLTRSLGLLFAILSIHQAFLFYTRGPWRHAALMGAFAGLSVLSHIGTAPFAALSIALMFVAYCRRPAGVLGSVVALGVAVALAAPWVATVVGRHGWAPFVAARATGANAFSDATARFEITMRLAEFGINNNGEPLFPIFGVLAIFGTVASLRARQWLLPAWWMLITVFDARASGTFVSPPVSLLAGIAISAVLWPLLFPQPAAEVPGAARGRWDRWESWLVLAGLFGYAAAGAATRNPSVGGEGKLLRGIPTDERAAMAWVDRSTPGDARFVVLTGPGHVGIWGDRVSEWFPVLANRVSVATIQGREWIKDGTFKTREAAYDKLQACAGERDAACLDAWSRVVGFPYTHVFVSKERSFANAVEPLASALRTDPAFSVIYDGPGALVARRVGPPAASPAAGS